MRRLNFIVCPSYHGATLLSLLLNNHSRITSLGDTVPARRYLDAPCACGKTVRTCDFWSKVLTEVDANRFTGGEKMLPLWPRLAGDMQRCNQLAGVSLGTLAHLAGPRVWSLFRRRRDEYTQAYSRFYSFIMEAHGTEVFVDGSKSMSKALVLSSMLPHAEVRIVHIVRDPRDYYCSNRKNNGESVTLTSSSREWLSRHLAILAMVRLLKRAGYIRVSYEDLCEQPATTLRSVFGLLGVDYEDVLHEQRTSRKNHVIGNVSLTRFDGTIRASSHWRLDLSESEARRVIRLTAPLSGHFGYVER